MPQSVYKTASKDIFYDIWKGIKISRQTWYITVIHTKQKAFYFFFTFVVRSLRKLLQYVKEIFLFAKHILWCRFVSVEVKYHPLFLFVGEVFDDQVEIMDNFGFYSSWLVIFREV